MIGRIGILLCVGVLLAALAGAQDLGEEIVTIESRPGDVLDLLLT